MHKGAKPETTILFGFKTAFGGGKSTGFCLIYDSVEDAKRLEPKYRLVRVSQASQPPHSCVVEWFGVVMASGVCESPSAATCGRPFP